MSLFKLDTIPALWEDSLFTIEEAQQRLAQPHHHLWVIHEDQPEAPPYAHLLVSCVPGSPADVLTLHTHPDLRRKGYALRLMAAFIPFAQQQGCPAATLEVRASNHPAINLYELCGFTQSHSRKNYYSNPTEDALVLTLALPGA